MSRKDIVNQISQAIRRVDPTATAILYGSEARGDARPDSDIDVWRKKEDIRTIQTQIYIEHEYTTI